MTSRMLTAAILTVCALTLGACDNNKKKGDDKPVDKVSVAVPPAPEPSTLTPAPAVSPVTNIEPAPAPAPAPSHAAAHKTAKAAKTSAGDAAQGKSYVVQKGDNLTKISKKFYGDDSHVKALAAANGLSDANLIKAGQTIVIP